MASKYWLKLYHEMLDDPKIGQLRAALRWRFIECLLVAGECDEGGYLPDVQQYAWRVRADAETVETDFVTLADAGLLSQDNGQWLVTQFAERQAPVSGAERVARHRERQKKAEYYEGDTGPLRKGNGHVTKRYTDIDIDTDKIEIQKRGEAPAADRALVPMVNALVEATGMSGHLNWSTLSKLAADLEGAGYSFEQVATGYGPGGWWKSADWRGKRGDLPTPKQIRETVRAATTWDGKDRSNGTWANQPAEFDNRMKGLEEALENEGLA
jgi:hypothetical protein